MNVVVADACAIIFLAKLNRLSLVAEVFPGFVWVPELVCAELGRETIPQPEQERIRVFLKKCRTVAVLNPHFPASALSLADRCVLTLAGKHQGAVILTDDMLVRRIAVAEGLAVAGTVGVLIRAQRAGLLTKAAAR